MVGRVPVSLLLRRSKINLMTFVLIGVMRCPLFAATVDFDHSVFDKVLRSCVREGRVDYRCAQENIPLLNLYLSKAANFPSAQFDAFGREEKISFLINVHNAFVMKRIAGHYPVGNLKDLSLKEEDSMFAIFGRSVTLHQIEYDMLRKKFRDERLYVALFRGAKGGPPLRKEVYKSENLDHFLDEDVRKFVNDPNYNRIQPDKKRIYLSPLFKWYAKDFILNYGDGKSFSKSDSSETAVLSFIANYIDSDKREYIEQGHFKIKYLSYDWTIDEVSSTHVETRN